MTSRLLDLILEREELADLDPAARRLEIRSLLAARDEVEDLPAEVSRLIDDIDGFGPLAPHMSDPLVTDVLVNGHRRVWVERAGALVEQISGFASEDELRTLIERLFSDALVRIDATCPIADARLRDGSRIHVVLPPLSPEPLVSIRKVPRTPSTLEDLVELGMMSESDGARLRDAVTMRKSILIAGATGTGKTTLAGALLSCIGSNERVVIVEEVRELRPTCPHVVHMTTRAPNTEEVGGVDLAALVRAALRMRPDRLVVGEVRGAEAAVALGAMSTGHEGSVLTIHARSVRHACDRLVSLALMGSRADESTLRREMADAVDIVVHLERFLGRRRVAAIADLGE